MPSGIYLRTEKHRNIIKEAMNLPEVKVRLRFAMLKQFENPVVRAKNKAIQKKIWSNPKLRAKMKVIQKKIWNTPEFKAKHYGKNNSSWIDGQSYLPYSYKFNEAFKQVIRDRDGNTCQLCSKTEEQDGRNLNVHHIYYDKDNECVNPYEFVTLCRSCNTKVNSRRDFWIDYFLYNFYTYKHFDRKS